MDHGNMGHGGMDHGGMDHGNMCNMNVSLIIHLSQQDARFRKSNG